MKALLARCALLVPLALPALAHADSLGANVSTAYSAVINFDRADYYVASRYNTGTPTAALASLQTSILFNPLVPDAAGNIALPANFADQVARLRAASPNAGYTLGLGSLNAIAGNTTAINNFKSQLAGITATYGFTGVDIDWEDMPGNVAAATYGATVRSVASTLRASNIIVSTSHASGSQYLPYVAQIATSVDFLNLQFYYSTTGAMPMTTFRSTLSNYLAQGLQASQIRIGLPSYGMVNPNATTTTDKWRSWTNLINAGVDVRTLNQWTDPKNGETYYFSGLDLIQDKVEYAMSNGFAGVFSWEITQDRDYTHPLSIYALIDELSVNGTPTLELHDSNTGTGALGTGTVTLGSGAVLNNGVLRFARTAAATHANRIDGYGRVEVTGTGAVTLTGANTYTGGTTIASGATLNVGAGAASGALGTGDIANAGTLAFNHADNATLNNAVSGSGKFSKKGAGTLTLAGAAKSFGSLELTGGTLVSTGSLDIAGNALLGMGAAGTFRQTGGTVNITTGASGWGAGLNIGHKAGGNGVYELSGGTLNVLNGATVVGAGGGSSGTLTLTGGTANLKGLAFGTSAGDTATVHLSGGARLNLGAAGIANIVAPTGSRTVNLGAGTVGALADWSTSLALTLNDAATGTTFDTRDAADGTTARTLALSGALGGAGKLTKAGAGTLTLSGANPFAGGLRIAGGTLVAAHANAPGAGDVTLAGGALQLGEGAVSGVTLASGKSLVSESGTDSGLKFMSVTAPGLTLVGGGRYDFSSGTVALDLNHLFGAESTYTLIAGGTGNVDATSYTFLNATAGFAYAFADGTLTVTAVPEPSTYGLLGAGALAAAALVRRRRARVARPSRP